MILNEIGTLVAFEFKKILNESIMMKSDLYINSIFFFNKHYTGECNCRIDINQKNFFISSLLLEFLSSKFELSTKKVVNNLKDMFEYEYINFEIIVMLDWELDRYDIFYKNDRFIKI